MNIRKFLEYLENEKPLTRKIADLAVPCRDPEHNPPMFMVYENGIYEHKCPGCGRVTRFTVANPSF